MCGIAGFFDLEGGNRPRDLRPLLDRMVASIQHRGPDGRGSHVEEELGFGHARLSIIDLAGGAQPMADADQRALITFNGEIFNYLELKARLAKLGCKFTTASDTEVILQSYLQDGLNCVDQLNGDFAFAIWDRARRRLVLARDRIGVRPLYTALHDGFLFFASEVKALFQVPGLTARLDPFALSQCFSLWFPLAPRTVFQGIEELPPGHVLIAERGSVTVRSYWRPEYPDRREPPSDRNEHDLAESLKELLSDATRIRLRADVPIGAYLSGGLDSSAVAALIQRFAPGRLRTFSVSFASPEFDEARFQHEVARLLDCEHQSIEIDDAAIVADFPAVVRHAERPVLRTAPAPLFRLARLVRQNGFKVVLTGEGADEALGGYDLFKEAKIRRFWSRQPQSRWRPHLLGRLYPYLPGLRAQNPAFLRAFFKVGLDQPNDPLFSHRPRWATNQGLSSFFSDELAHTLAGYNPIDDLRGLLPTEFKAWHPLSQSQYLETAYLLPAYILSSQGDRMAMASAVEARFPFLDHRVVEFGARLAPRLKLRGLNEKYLLRRSMESLLPPLITARPKQPFRAPDGQVFLGPARADYVRDLLSPGAIEAAGYFDSLSVEKLVQKCRCAPTISTRDSMALAGILSVQLLDSQFIQKSS